MKRLCWATVWFACALVLLLGGVGGVTTAVAEEAAPEASAEEAPEATVLPEWAPADPSDEFLRGLRALLVVPTEQVLAPAGDNEELATYLKKMMNTLWPPAFELFGSLSEEEMATFFAEEELRLPVPSLPAEQQTVLDRWLAAADTVIARAPVGSDVPPKGGYMALMKEEGAEEDLSNVDVGFGSKNGMVGVYFWIKKTPGGEGPVISNDFAMLKAGPAAETEE
jgi:hypothetical protein